MKQFYTLYTTILISILSFGNINSAEAQTNYALNFDGTNDYVTFGAATGINGTMRGTNPPVWTAETGMAPPPANNRSLAVQWHGSVRYIWPGSGYTKFHTGSMVQKNGTGSGTTTGGGGVTAVPVITKGRGEGETGNLNVIISFGIS